ncbi:sirohydrochlorin chelatase [Marinomonas balearica]|uniref:Sirohydrochlorin cobaltochelatase n=1 Tax=Marinomonas balearica TaxID=491947 RepID=A0A4R6M801_9GAMM|nr:CbiX/SirB N-terminal domain-containing protein [Marinomonas balearica]TDO96770.1 sirohydrochlorin cobaltochelatase [Marinomonas balearica]
MQLNSFDHIILLAHGSPDPKWKEPFEVITSNIVEKVGRDSVSLAFMELTSPTLEDVIASLPQSKKKLAVLPLFLAVGRHLRHDVPAQIKSINDAQALDITLLPPIGDDDAVRNAIEQSIIYRLGD